MRLLRVDYDKYAEIAYAPVFDEHFSADELKELIAFFRTKPDQKLVAVLPKSARPTRRSIPSSVRGIGRRALTDAHSQRSEGRRMGQPFFYVGDGTHYRIVSAGADRRFEWSSRRLDLSGAPSRQSADSDADIIYQDGDFTQYPPEWKPQN